MLNLFAGLITTMASIVLTTEMVELALPEGTSREVAEAYLTSMGVDSIWRPRDPADAAIADFPWTEDDIGVLDSGIIRNVRSKWWMPSFGKVMIIHIGISVDGKVTELDFQEFLSGWP